MIRRRTAILLVSSVLAAVLVPLSAGTALASVSSTDFGATALGTTTATQSSVVPLHATLSDLPAGTVVYQGGGGGALDIGLAVLGLSAPVTAGALLGVTGDISVTFAINGFSSSGAASDFALDPAPCLAATAGSSCTVAASFAPTAVGARSATYIPTFGSIVVTAANPGLQSLAVGMTGYLVPAVQNLLAINLAGTGTPALVTPATLAFGSVRLGVSATLQSPLTNASDQPIALTPNVIDSGGDEFDPPPHQFVTTLGTCTDPMAPHSSCLLSTTFTPVPYSFFIHPVSSVLYLGPAGPLQVAVPLSGHSVSARASFDVPAVAFPSTPLGEVSEPVMVTVSNSSFATAPLDVTGVNLGGSADFTVVDSSDCSAPLLAGDSCVLLLAFSPARLGARHATLTLVDDEPPAAVEAPISLALTGTATPAADLSIHLGAASSRAVGKAFAKVVYTVTLANHGPSSAAGVRTALLLPEAAEFVSTTRTTCIVPPVGSTGAVTCALGSMASGKSITFTVTVNVPEATGTKVSASSAVTSSVFDPVGSNNAAVRTLSIK